MNDTTRLLIEKYLQGATTEMESKIVEVWLDKWVLGQLPELQLIYNKEELENIILYKINERIRQRQRKLKTRRLIKRTAVAASFILVLSFATYRLWYKPMEETGHAAVVYESVQPGSKSAVLLTADGARINLSDGATHTQQSDDLQIKLLGGGASLESVQGEAIRTPNKLNEVRIPKGGQYELELMDGTRVYLNSASRLSFPSRFDREERRVNLEGEAYFAVKPGSKPFIVETAGQEVKVLGTEFNVQAYDRTYAVTTLAEGKVAITLKKGGNATIRPGQQAVSRDNIIVKDVDVESVVSWKSGYFSFDYRNIDEVMQDVSRWYDIEYVIKEGVNRKEKIGGTFSRNKSIEEFLNHLEAMLNLKIRKENGKIIVTN